jgi:hypothetical protein
MDHRDPRVKELSNLKLALATFALQLDEFEARMRVRSLKTGAQVSKPVPPERAKARGSTSVASQS